MNESRRMAAGLLAVLAIAILSGCLERKERVIVNADGSAEIRLIVEGEDENDITQGDRLPQPGGYWLVERSTRETPEGKLLHRLAAIRQIPAGVKLPSSFGERSDPMEKAYLQFPSEITIEERVDGWYYHFHRTYEPRAYAQVGFLQDAVSEQASAFAAKQDSGQEIGLVEFKGISELLVKVAIGKIEIFARQAFLETNPNTPQDAWLAVHDALEELRKGADYDRLAVLLKNADQQDNSQLMEALAEEFDTVTMDTIITTLQASAYVRDTASFRNRFVFHKKAYEVTEDIGDDRFEVSVQMPGSIVSHNGDTKVNNIVTWTFPGKMLYDRTVELMVTSHVAR